MLNLARENDWLMIKQEIKPDPIETVNDILDRRQRLKLQDGSAVQGKPAIIDSNFYQRAMHKTPENDGDDFGL